MRVPDGVAAKLDAGLMSQLVAAHPGERLRVVARLAESAGSPDMPAASAFPSREDWRKHLIARQQAQVEADIGGALAAIREMGVIVAAGGRQSRTVVLEGTVQELVRALELADVMHADIDRKVSVTLD